MSQMRSDIVRKYASEYKNFVFVGESGSGKTELSINFALELKKVSNKAVHVFDMDQTKPLYRLRDSAPVLEAQGIAVHSQEQVLDAPLTVGGVLECLGDKQCHAVLDIGGNGVGARMIGRFSRAISGGDTCVFFVINSYRPWSGTAGQISDTIGEIVRACRVESYRVVSNPNLGSSTTIEELREGHARLKAMLEGEEIAFICAGDVPELSSESLGCPVFSIQRHIAYPGE